MASDRGDPPLRQRRPRSPCRTMTVREHRALPLRDMRRQQRRRLRKLSTSKRRVGIERRRPGSSETGASARVEDAASCSAGGVPYKTVRSIVRAVGGRCGRAPSRPGDRVAAAQLFGLPNVVKFSRGRDGWSGALRDDRVARRLRPSSRIEHRISSVEPNARPTTARMSVVLPAPFSPAARAARPLPGSKLAP